MSTKPQYPRTATPVEHNGSLYSSTDELCVLWERYYTELLNEHPSEATAGTVVQR